ncbi:hypothetical protein VTJ04DRAFT_5772 [Mycothermus thermophilus]|uniref:uncharacterized protein n=1 Tax=Humicola insolens TaxID=85995 RepID=UPI00374288A3
MQFRNVVTVLALAMTATAMPAAHSIAEAEGMVLDHSQRSDTTITCSSNSQPVCCINKAQCFSLLGNVLALLLGQGVCKGGSYCCESNNIQNGLININTGCNRVL